MKHLTKAAGTIPFLLAVFLNAFVDLGHKIVIQNTVFKIYDGQTQIILTAVLNGLILLPFILLFSPAGYMADRFPKNKVMRATGWGAVILTVAITLCYAMGWFWPAFGMTFLLAAQSAFYSPAKFGYIRGFFGKDHLAEANGTVSAISIIAILSGTLVYSIFFEGMYPENPTSTADIVRTLVPIGFILIANSIFELIMLYRLPQVETPAPQAAFDMRRYLTGRLVSENLEPVIKREVIRLSILGLAMFWSIGQVMLAAFPAFAKEQTGETNTIVIQAILAASGLGIALGSIIASRVSRNYIETGLIPVGAAGIAVGLWILPNLTNPWLMGVDFWFIGTMGGLFIVPLNAMVQFYAKQSELGKVLAGNNLIQNIAMLSFLLLTAVSALAGVSSKQLLFFIALFSVVGGCYTVYKLPQSLVRFLLGFLMSHRYRVNVQGMKHIPSRGGVLLLGNHISWIDWAIVQIACPRPVQFVMLRSIYERWYLTWFFKMFGCVPIESGRNSKRSLQIVTERLNEGKVVCLFPEGSISRTGHLAEFRRGYERAAKAANEDVVIQPFYLRGLWGSQFSRSSDKLKHASKGAWKRDIIVAFGEAIDKETPADILKRRVFDLSVSSWQEHVEVMPTLAQAWIDSAKGRGGDTALIDAQSGPLSAHRALAVAIAFAKKMQCLSPEQNIGVLMPSSAGGVLANMATLLSGKTIVNLNYTSNAVAFASAVEQADIHTIYSSKKFIQKLAERGIDFSETLSQVKVIYLEELKQTISPFTLISTLLCVKVLPAWMLKRLYTKQQSNTATAAILFSSGSEGSPKGVMLSHRNFMANLKQIADVLNMDDKDVVMASLPLFHAFGLTVTQFMPLIEGLPMVCHPDPTDVLGISKAIASNRVTFLCGTSTFLRLYCRNAKIHPLMLESLKHVVAGAERLQPRVREAFKLKFNKDILEGYGATETTPVASVNLPDALDTHYWKVQLGGRPGTVGMPLPGTSFKIVAPNTLEELATGDEGMILIGGAQVMQGYLNNSELSDQAIRHIGDARWYVTGDKGSLDEDGFLTIVDRYSRFAKLGGEMISLTAVEQLAGKALNALANHNTLEKLATGEEQEAQVMAVNIHDDKKGEKIVLLSEAPISLTDLKREMLHQGCNSLTIPAKVVTVEVLPKLGSGKADFASAKKLASDQPHD